MFPVLFLSRATPLHVSVHTPWSCFLSQRTVNRAAPLHVPGSWGELSRLNLLLPVAEVGSATGRTYLIEVGKLSLPQFQEPERFFGFTFVPLILQVSSSQGLGPLGSAPFLGEGAV